jgi:hypothetical protein
MVHRAIRFSSLGVVITALTALNACSSSSSPAGPPLNDAGKTKDAAKTHDSAARDGAAHADSRPAHDSATGGKDSATTTDGGPAPACSSLPGKVVYIESGDSQEALLKQLGRQLRDNANITLAFELTGSCTLAPDVYAGTAIPQNTNMLYIPSTAEDPSWTTSDAELTCTTSATAGTTPDLGIAALLPSSCAGVGAPPSGIGSFIGPIQAYTFVVPTAEFGTQKSISADEAYYAIGDGANNPVTWNGAHEWNVPSELFLRPASKSTLVVTALNIGLTAAEATLTTADGGTSDGRILEPSSTDVVTAVAASTSMQALGILGDEVFDANRSAGIDILAFQAFGQSLGYYPDSTTTSFDKQNIRDGHYALWSPTVWITPVDASGAPSNGYVKYVIDLVLGTQNALPPGGLVDGGAPIDGIGDIVGVSLTPSCAMQVTRSADGAPLTPYKPAAPCTCHFLSKVPNAAPLPASCVTCSTSKPCATGACFNGYCEVPPAPPTTGAPGCDVSDGGTTSILNACTNATSIDKTGVVLPAAPDGGLAPLNP